MRLERYVLVDEINAEPIRTNFFNKIEKKIKKQKDYKNGPYFSILSHSLTRANEIFLTIEQNREVVTDSKIYFLEYKDETVALAVQRRNESNKTELLLIDYSNLKE